MGTSLLLRFALAPRYHAVWVVPDLFAKFARAFMMWLTKDVMSGRRSKRKILLTRRAQRG
jgi:hypothetical protein